MEARVWFFQANPANYDIQAALGALDRIWWRVPQHTGEIHVGDVAVLWRSGQEAGIVGLGRISSEPEERPSDESEIPFVLADEERAIDATRVLVSVQRVSFIARDQLRTMPELQHNQILVAPMGTVFPVSGSEWAALRKLLPDPPNMVEEAGSALPPAFAWPQRAKGVLPMPGGYNGYLTSLRRVCVWVADERPTTVELARSLETILSIRPAAARLKESFLRKTGIMENRGGNCTLGPWTEKWLATGDDRLIVALLHGRCQFMGEMLAAARNPQSNQDLLTRANDLFHMGWDTQTQISNRRGWLQSAGMLTEAGDGKVQLTDKGAELLADIPLYDPMSGPAVTKTVDDGPQPSEAGQQPIAQYGPIPNVGEIVEAISRTATDSGRPDLFEKAVRDAFAFLGFQAEWLGGSGRTDVLLDAALGPADAYRVVVDCKTSASGSVGDHQVDWVTLSEHKAKHEADHILLVAPDPSGSRLFARARQQGVAVLSADQLSGLCRQHFRTPLGLDDYRSMFSTDADVKTLTVDERAEEVKRLVDLAAVAWGAVRDSSTVFGRLSARDLLLILSGQPVAEGTTQEELQTLLDTLASPLLNVLHGSRQEGYRVTTSANVARRRIEVVGERLAQLPQR